MKTIRMVVFGLALAGSCARVAAAATDSTSSGAVALDPRILVAARDAEGIAVRSGQPRQNVIMEVAKAVRDVVWSSGLPPDAVLSSLKRIEADVTLTPPLLTGIRIVEREIQG